MAKKSNVKIPTIQIIRIIVFLFIGFSLFFSYTKIIDFVTSSPIFQVKEVVIETTIQFIDTTELRRLIGRNIFNVDIEKLQDRIQSRYPQISQLRVVRELPDRIKVLAKKREAVFQFSRGGKFLLVDSEGVGMYYSPSALELPIVSGILPTAKIVPGGPIVSKNTTLALAILREFKSRPHTSHLKITSLDLSNPSKIVIALGDALHVVIDQDSYAAKLDMLDGMVAQRKIDFTKVKYIDIRFNEPVLGGNEK